MGKRENSYQYDLIRRIEALLPGCIVLKNDEQYLQGIPDLTVLYGPYYALLEVKRSVREMMHPEPNQDYYLRRVTEMHGIAAFIYPENEDEVLDEIQRAFKS